MSRFVISLLCTVLLGGIVFAQKNDISEADYRQAEAKANELIKASNYRSERKAEFFEVRGQAGHLSEWDIREVVQPNKWRTVEVRNYDGKSTKSERLWDGKALFTRDDDGEWKQFSGGGGGGGRIESGQVTTKYRYLGKAEVNGKTSDLYELESLRIANKFSRNDMIVVRYNKRIRSWYGADGRLLQKIEENTIEGREELSSETTTFEYDSDIKIEAPIK